ncbi:oligosaccharide flippase family protein [Streptomyces sp. NPDC052107]|uniref:oligosaccharide flippase family protein n=1 Tax=Streptomyces sp. NPDC052107 TaxID=3155632 RepID=UPI00342DCAE1
MRWTLLGSIATLVVQMPYTAVMSRLLSPGDFGLIGLALFMLRFVSFFAQGGLNSAVTQRPVLNVRDIRAAMAFGIVTGIGVYVAAWAIMPFAVQVVHGPPELTSVCRVLGLTFVISALGATAVGVLRRTMRYRAIAMVEFGSYLIGYCGLGVTSAVLGNGVWSLVYACLGQNALMTVGCWVLAKHDLRPLFDFRAVKQLASVGAKVSLVGFLEFLSLGGDNVLVGRYAGMDMLGHYNRAWFLASLPLLQVAMALNKVLLPAFSCIQAQSARLRLAYVDSITVTTLLFIPMGAVIAACANNAVHVVLGAEWTTAADLVPLLAAVGALNVISYFPATVAEATGRVWPKVTIEILHLIVLSMGAGVAMAAGTGIIGLVIAVLVSRFMRHGVYVVYICRVFPGSMRSVTIAHTQSSMVALVLWLSVTTAGRALEGIVPPLVALVAQLLTVALLGGFILMFGRNLNGIRVVRSRALVPVALSPKRCAKF